ncbi:MAG: ROK family protein, partial [Bacteroidales bacterium]
FSNKYTKSEIVIMLVGKGGMVAYLGTNSFKEVCEMAENGNEKAILVRDTASYQIGKEIGAMAIVLKGKIDAIILTGGMAYQESNIKNIRSMVDWIAKVVVYPGEDELRALAFSGLLALKKEIEIKMYN